jgi:conserved oligomeric Golgi complex subunit 4
MHYVTALTSLFESIAMIVSQHQPVVEKYYGDGKMYNVIKRLIEECDRVVTGLLESWEEDRNARRKVK